MSRGAAGPAGGRRLVPRVRAARAAPGHRQSGRRRLSARPPRTTKTRWEMALARTAEAAAGRYVTVLARWMAYGGGVTLTSAAVLTVASITGRALLPLGLGPIKGDYELVGIGCALAIFAFLPWCQLRRGHVTVDIFVSPLPLRVAGGARLHRRHPVHRLQLHHPVAAVPGLRREIPLWIRRRPRTPSGFGSKPYFPETTYELAIPLWIPYALALLGAAVFFVVSLYTMWRSLNWTLDRPGARRMSGLELATCRLRTDAAGDLPAGADRPGDGHRPASSAPGSSSAGRWRRWPSSRRSATRPSPAIRCRSCRCSC